MRKVILVAVAVAVLSMAAAADSPSLDANPRVSFEPATVRLKLTIPPDKAHAFYCLSVVSDAYDTTSCRQLEGSNEARVRWIEFKDLPAGAYTAVVDIQTSDGRNRQARAGFQVLGKGMTPESELDR